MFQPMRSVTRPALVLVLALLAVVTARAVDVEQQREKLAAGELFVQAIDVPGSSMPRVRLTAVVWAPPDVVWELIDRCGDYRLVMPRTSQSRELERRHGVVRCESTLDAPWPVGGLKAVTRGTHVAQPDFFQRTWTLESGDFRSNEGRWTVTPFDDNGWHSLVVYEVHLEPKRSLPGFLVDRVQRFGLQKTIDEVRRVSMERLEARRAARGPRYVSNPSAKSPKESVE